MVISASLIAACLSAASSVRTPETFTSSAAFLRACPGARVTLSFENSPADLSGKTRCGITFQAPGAPLRVVLASDTRSPDAFYEDVIPFRKEFSEEPKLSTPVVQRVDSSQCRLPATTGRCILSPGGSSLGPGRDPQVENDDLILIFDPPVQAFGFDLLSQSRDGQSNTCIRVIDTSGAVLFQGDIPIGSSEGRAGGSDFWGVFSSSRNIARIEIDDRDDNDRYPDCNIGFDSIRVYPQPLPADVDGDGILTAADLNAFMNQYNAGEKAADFNNDGEVDRLDLAAFLAAFSRR